MMIHVNMLNYNADASACNAEVDDASCTYAAEGLDCEGNCLSGELLTMNDSWGDGWNGAVLTINGVDYTVEKVHQLQHVLIY